MVAGVVLAVAVGLAAMLGVSLVDVASAQSYEYDLAIEQTDEPDPVVAGENVTYTLTVTNRSTTAFGSVEITDDL
ncbi:MAG: hypothetical protein BRC32_03370, partial [Actinobacteria bacterium QS_8_72_14]